MAIPIITPIIKLFKLSWMTYFSLRELMKEQKNNPVNSKDVLSAYKRRWATRFLQILGVRTEWQGVLPEDLKGILVVSNHRSFIDIPVIMSNIDCSLLSKAEVAKWKVIGPAAVAVGTIFVERQSKTSRSASLDAIHNALKSNKTVAIFPEGTTNPNPIIGDYKIGSFGLAFNENYPILPIHIEYDNKNYEWVGDATFQGQFFKYIGMQKAMVTIRIGEIIYPKDFLSAEEIKNHAENFARHKSTI